MEQRDFLFAMGINQRVEILKKNKPKKSVENLVKQYERLCSPEQMGRVYKFFYAAHKSIGEVYPFLSEKSENKREYS